MENNVIKIINSDNQEEEITIKELLEGILFKNNDLIDLNDLNEIYKGVNKKNELIEKIVAHDMFIDKTINLKNRHDIDSLFIFVESKEKKKIRIRNLDHYLEFNLRDLNYYLYIFTYVTEDSENILKEKISSYFNSKYYRKNCFLLKEKNVSKEYIIKELVEHIN